jgi:hypothetical protein
MLTLSRETVLDAGYGERLLRAKLSDVAYETVFYFEGRDNILNTTKASVCTML